MAEQHFSDKVALVTGAASGIGRACARLFAEQGASVIVSDVAAEGGEEMARLIQEAGGKAAFIRADVSDAKEVEALVGTTMETFGRLDCAVNNAGIEGVLAPTADYPEETWNKVLAINPAYTAAKHGVVGLTKVAALEYSALGIRVNALCPGFIETPMVMERGVEAGIHPEVYEQIAQLHPIGRLGKSEEIAEAAVWLCSEAASFVTGHAMTADG